MEQELESSTSAADVDMEENEEVLEEEEDVAEDEAVDDEAEADDEPEPAAASAPPSDDGAAKSDPPSEAPPAKELPPADMACPEGHVLKKQSGYLFYSAQFRASCKARVDEEHADAAAGARSQMVMKALAAGWSALDDATKKKYGDDAPWEAKKIKEKKPTKKEKAKAAAAADAKKGWETLDNALDVQALRDLKMLYDEGVLTAAEFAAKKAMILGTPPPAAASSNGAASPAPAAPAAPAAASTPAPASTTTKKRKPKEGGSAAKGGDLKIPTSALKPFLEDACQVRQDNPKREGTKSAELYDKYKAGATLKELLDLGAKKADLSNDIGKGYITLEDPDRHAELLDTARAPEPRGEGSAAKRPKHAPPPPPDGDDAPPAMSPAGAHASFRALAGRYYVRRVHGDASAGLEDGVAGPASYGRATGALSLVADPAVGGMICMKGIMDEDADGGRELFTPRLSPKMKGAAVSADGKFKFKLNSDLKNGLTKASGSLFFSDSGVADANGAPILVGTFEFHAKRPGTADAEELDCVWEEDVRFFQAADDADEDWPL